MNHQQKESSKAAVAIEISELDSLLTREFKPISDSAKTAIEKAVSTLAQQALADTALVNSDALKSIEAIISQIDKKLSEQVNLILHNDEFQKLEGTWRGLKYLVSNTESGENLKIRVFNISKKDIAKTLKKFKGASWDQSPIFKKLYEDEFGMPGGEPYGCLIGDYYFDHSPSDVEILKGMAQIAAASLSPFIAASSPSLLNMQSWQELNNPRDISKIVSSPDYAAWKSLRASEDSKYLGLTMPRFLSRLPYGAKSDPVEEFAFEEEIESGNHDAYTWSNAAYAMGTNINRAFKEYGWCSRIRGVESGGMVEGLPCHTFPTDDGGVDLKCPTEISIGDRRDAELSANGLLSLCHWKNTDYAVFIGAQSLHKPAEFDDADATANAKLGARLPYLFSTCRFGHYLKCIVRDKIGSFKERGDMEVWLNNWISQFVTSDPNASDEVKARFPLAEAKVEVEEIENNPGYYRSKFYLRPHYQLEGLTVSLRLVSKLPSLKGDK